MSLRTCVIAAAAFGLGVVSGGVGHRNDHSASAADADGRSQQRGDERPAVQSEGEHLRKKAPQRDERTTGMLIEPRQLQKRLHEPNVRILDVRSKEDYARGHVPGAARVDVGQWKALALKEGGLHDAKAWSKRVGQLGISEGTQVVVYGGPLPDTARIWWLLKYVGVKQVSILNGGWDWWTKKDRPTESTAPSITATTFRPDFQVDRLEEIDRLKKSVKTGTVKLVDARSTDEFTGKEIRGQRGGHIPGAAHLEWKELLSTDGRFKTVQQLKTLFRKRGILPEETAVCY